MKKSNKIFLGVLAGFAIFVVGFSILVRARFSSLVTNAQETEAKSNLSSIYTAEETYHKEFGEYTSQFGAMGFSPEGKIQYQIYLTDESMPESLRVRLKPQDLPFVRKDEYQAIAIKEDENGRLSGFKINASKKIEPLVF